MVFLRLLGLLCRDVGKDLLRHRGQHFLAVLTLALGLFLAGGRAAAGAGTEPLGVRMETLAKVTVFAAEGSSLDEAEGRLQRDPRFVKVRRISSEEATRRFLESSREAGLMLKSLGEPIPETLELTLRPDLLAAHRAMEVGDSLRALPGVGDVVVDQERLEGLQQHRPPAAFGPQFPGRPAAAGGRLLHRQRHPHERAGPGRGDRHHAPGGRHRRLHPHPPAGGGRRPGPLRQHPRRHGPPGPLAAAGPRAGQPVAPAGGTGPDGLLLPGQHGRPGRHRHGHRRPRRPVGLLEHPARPCARWRP